MLTIIRFPNNKLEALLFNSKTRMQLRVGLIAVGPEAKAKGYWDQAIRKWTCLRPNSSRCHQAKWINKSSRHDNLLIRGLLIIKWVTIPSKTLEIQISARSCQLRRKCNKKRQRCQLITRSTGQSSSKRRKLCTVTAMTSMSNSKTLKVGKVRHSRICPKFLKYYRMPRLRRKTRSTKRLYNYCSNWTVRVSISRKSQTSIPTEKSAMPLDNPCISSLGAFTKSRITNKLMKHLLHSIANAPTNPS